MPAVTRIVGATLIVAGIAGLCSAAAAAPARLEVAPARIELCELERGAPVVVNLENTGKGALDGLAVTAAGPVGLDSCKLEALPEGMAQSCDAVLRCKAPPCAVGPVPVRASYQRDGRTWLAATTSVEIVAPGVAMSAIATVSAKASRGEIGESSPGIAYVYVTNLSPYPLTVQLAFHDAGAFHSADPHVRRVVKLAHLPATLSVAPLATATAPFGLTMLALGKDTVVVDAAVSWFDGKCRRAGALTTSFDVETGSSELAMLLKLLGLPALLLLPGVLLLSASAILWRFGLALEHPRAPKSEFWFAYASPYFWVLAVCVSFVWYRVYAWLHTDLRETYRLAEVITLWSIALAVGALLHLVAFAVLRLVVWRRQRRSAARTPSAADDPWTTLNKLALRGGGLDLARATFGTPPATRFILADGPDGKLWVCPAISYAPPGDASLASSIVAQRTAGDLAGLVESFRPARGTLRWVAKGHPQLIDSAGIHRLPAFPVLTTDE
jgi:hypothetical protein